MLRSLTLAAFLLFALLWTMITVAGTGLAIAAPQSTGTAATLAVTSTGVITVTTVDDEVNNDGDCSLREALEAATVDAVVDGCPAGHGADVIVLPQGHYVLTAGQLEITGTVTLSGSTSGSTILDGNQQNRILYIDPDANVTLAYLDVLNGQGAISDCCDYGDVLNGQGAISDCCDYGDGGGIANYGITLLTYSTVHNNHAGRYAPDPYATYGGNGGGIFNRGVLTVANSTISANQAGAGFYHGHGDTPHCGNEGNGGGIANFGLLRVENSTIAKNAPGTPDCPTYTGAGGGIYSDGSASGGTIRNSIINDNQINDCAGAFITSLGYNLFQTIERCFLKSTVSTDRYWAAYLGPLKNNGGPTLTHALNKKSPAIDAGACTDSTGITVTVDQRGEPRRQGDGCDIGAFESPYTSTFAIHEIGLPLIAAGSPCSSIVTPCNLTRDAASDGSPSWSPDSSRIAFVKTGTQIGAYVMNADGSRANKVADQGDQTIWSPDGSKIAILSMNNDIFVMDANGNHLTNVTNTPDAQESSPAWSPDSSKILFQTGICCIPDVYVMNADGSQRRLLAVNAHISSSPWSPDGSEIVFGDGSFHIVSLDGTISTTLNTTAQPVGAPMWSPDGKKIAFACHRPIPNLSTDICTINRDGSQYTEVTSDGVAVGDPIWSPDSSKLLFVHTTDVLYAVHDIVIINASGGAMTQVTSMPQNSFVYNPKWSPDGHKVAYVSGEFVSDAVVRNVDIYLVGVGE